MPESRDLTPGGGAGVPALPGRWVLARKVAPPVAVVFGVAVLYHLGLLGWSIAAAAAGAGWLLFLKLRSAIREQERLVAAPDPLKDLERNLSRCRYTLGFDEQGGRATAQLEQLLARRKSYLAILKERLDPGELTFSRYADALDQAAQGVIDGLKGVYDELSSTASLEPSAAEERLKALGKSATPSDAERTEIAALRERLGIRDQRLASVARILADNERALTSIDQTVTAISSLKTGARLTGQDLEGTLQLLQEVAARARRLH